jgi:4-hydroxymandelate oxidase
MSDAPNVPTAGIIGVQDWVSADELEQLARVHLNPSLFDFVTGGAGAELTVAANREAFQRYRLRPRFLGGGTSVTTAVSVLGTELAMPVFISPMGAQWLLHPEAEAGTAAGAREAGAGFMLSADSVGAIEAVAAAAGSARWYQLYLRADRGLTRELVAAAVASAYRAFCVTIDVPVIGLRRRDLRNYFASGRGAPLGRLLPERPAPTNEIYPGVLSYAPVTPADIEWLRSLTDLPILLKGVMTAEDALVAIESGVAGIVVSNHGGRQLDHMLGTADVLPEIVEAVAGRAEILIDGGVRRGTDVAVAIALGARAVAVGRPAVWALSTGGPAAVARYLRGLAADLARTMVLLGVARVEDLGSEHVDRRFSRR